MQKILRSLVLVVFGVVVTFSLSGCLGIASSKRVKTLEEDFRTYKEENDDYKNDLDDTLSTYVETQTNFQLSIQKQINANKKAIGDIDPNCPFPITTQLRNIRIAHNKVLKKTNRFGDDINKLKPEVQSIKKQLPKKIDRKQLGDAFKSHDDLNQQMLSVATEGKFAVVYVEFDYDQRTLTQKQVDKLEIDIKPFILSHNVIKIVATVSPHIRGAEKYNEQLQFDRGRNVHTELKNYNSLGITTDKIELKVGKTWRQLVKIFLKEKNQHCDSDYQ